MKPSRLPQPGSQIAYKLGVLAGISILLARPLAAQATAEASPSPSAVPTLSKIQSTSIISPGSSPVSPSNTPIVEVSPSPTPIQAQMPIIEPVKATATPTPLQIDHISGNTVYFNLSDTPPLKLEASNMTSLGMLNALPGGKPFFLVTGRPCKDCQVDPMVLAFQAGNPRLYKFVSPGKVIDHKSHSIVMESRAFFGHCLYRKKEDVLLVFQKERVDRKRAPQASVFIAEPALDEAEGGKPYEHLHETLLERHEPRIADTFKLIHAHSCHEVPSMDRVTARHPIDLNLKRQKLEDDESDDETTKENQTDRDITPKTE